MDRMLSNLKESMDQTVLKKGNLSPVDKKQIFEAAIMKQEPKKRYFLAPFLTYAIIPSMILIFGVYYLAQLFIEERPISEETPSSTTEPNKNPNIGVIGTKDRQDDILGNPQWGNEPPAFLYDRYNVLYTVFNDDKSYISSMSDFGYYTKIYAKHFAALAEDPEVIDHFDDMARIAENLQLEKNLDNQTQWLEDLYHLVKKLIPITDPYGEYAGLGIYNTNQLYRSSLENWLTSIKESIREEKFDFFKENFEIYLAMATSIMAYDFAQQSDNPLIWDKIDELIKIAEKIAKEKDKNTRMAWIQDLEGIVDQTLEITKSNHSEGIKAVDRIYLPADEVLTNQLYCNDVTGKKIPDHLTEICKVYDQLKPLTEEEKDMYYENEGYFIARYAFHNEYAVGENGYGELFKDYGEYLLFTYLAWRTEGQPNAKAEVKGLRWIADFEEFYKLEDEEIVTIYRYGENGTFRNVLEHELQVATRMKNLNLPNVFNQWSEETAQYFLDALELYDAGTIKEAYLKYVDGLKRLHDMYFTIPGNLTSNY